ncbi:Tc5 transposase DNA-binding domain containing protein [Pyrenophora tritici-repentis]|nr:Tc5 transposase DNA-binding domain containing protein [Pyrenophora tritici-repentis]KAI1678086.1 Tc5 transposase DNA-binding domain containing protein [Pyrenophora tritici-repentis]
MDPIEAAIAAIDAHGPGEGFSYTKIAKEFGVVRSTLIRRHKELTQPRSDAHRKLHPDQEKEIVQYIQGLTAKRLPPTRAIIRSLASSVAGTNVSESWVNRFLKRNSNHLISKWTRGMDRARYRADSGVKYKLYFDLLHKKIGEYKIRPGDIYNMDEKGFLIGVTGRSKRVFGRRMWEKKEVTTGVQDGSREWISILACICADGSVLPPGIIYQGGSGGLQSDWVDDVAQSAHPVFLSSSKSGSSNNKIGLAWLKEVFEPATRPELIKKAFTATGIWPPNPVRVLKRFTCTTPEVVDEDEESTEPIDGSDWRRIYSLVVKVAKGERRSREVKRLRRTIHHLATQNTLLYKEVRGLLDRLSRKAHQQKSYPLKLQKNKDNYHGGAIFWSPRKIREAKERRIQIEQQRDREALQKAEMKELRDQARLYKLRLAQEKRAEREAARERRMKEKAEKEAERARKKADRDSKKAIQ